MQTPGQGAITIWLCHPVFTKRSAHQTLLMILQNVWWFVQNQQTYCLIIWKKLHQYLNWNVWWFVQNVWWFAQSSDILSDDPENFSCTGTLYHLNSIGIFITMIRWSYNNLVFITRILILVKMAFILKLGPVCLTGHGMLASWGLTVHCLPVSDTENAIST